MDAIDVIGAEYAVNLKKIRDAMTFTLLFDEDKKELYVKATITMKDTKTKKNRTWETKYPITGLVQDFMSRLNARRRSARNYHGANDAAVQGWLSDTYDRAVKLAKRVAENQAVKDVYHDVLPAVAPHIPGGTVALRLVDKAHDVLVKARAGSDVARKKLIAIRDKAQSNPAAREILDLLRRLNAALNAKQSGGEDVSGWLWNVPYRSNVSAMSIDPSNPFNAARALYRKGL